MRRPDGTIHRESRSVRDGSSALRRSMLRGVVALADAVSIGMQGLRIAVRESAGVEPTLGQMQSTLAAIGVGAAAVFVVAPAVLVGAWGGIAADLGEAGLRASVLVVYLAVVSRSPATQRLFGYHGAEHMTIAAFERIGRVPTIDRALEESPVHSRCGTSFVSLYVLVAGIVHAFVPRDPWPAAAAYRLLLTPVDAALAYELMRASARMGGPLAWLVAAPGRALQRITTRRPDREQVAVAVAAMEELDP